jgi:hypothetical protein
VINHDVGTAQKLAAQLWKVFFIDLLNGIDNEFWGKGICK